ncbi:MAG: hypothetical protein QXU97_02595 [Fervidicoccaceae archaeon]
MSRLYVAVDPSAVPREGELAWAHAGLFKSKGAWFLLDCSLTSRAREPKLARVLSIIRLPLEPSLTERPPIDAALLEGECSQHELEECVDYALRAAIELRERRRLESFSANRWALSHLLSPARWVIGDVERLGASLASGIKSSILLELLEETGLIDERSPQSFRRVLALYSIERKRKAVHVVIGSFAIKSSVLGALSLSSEMRRETEE